MFTAHGTSTLSLATSNGGGEPSALARLRPLLELANLVRLERELEDLLESIAATISSGLGWQTVVINLYRPAWDDFQVTTVHGNEDARSALLGSTSTWADWEPLMAERFLRHGAYIVRGDEVDWDDSDLPSFVPPGTRTDDPEAWDPEDSLLVPLAHSESRLLGVLSIDQPYAGRVPTDDELDLLCAMAAQAAHAVEQLQRRTEIRRHRAALEHLHEVSTRLSAVLPPEQVLDAVAQGIGRALSFDRVAVALREGDGFVPAASRGWGCGELTVRLSVGALEGLLEPQFEKEGCYLLTCDEALERLEADPDYPSRLNGRGPWAWDRHWLIVPLRSEGGETIGFVWADDPTDRLLPSPEKLRVLRMFANQAVTALELARTFAAEQEANELMRATVTSSPLATIRVDREGIVRAWNPAAELLYGWKADEVIGRPYPCQTVAQRLEFAHLVAPVLEGSSYRGLEVVKETRDGRRVDVSVSAAPIYDSGGNVVAAIAVHENIRGRKQAEAALRQSQELYRRVVETLTDVIALLDLDGTVLFTSHAVEPVLGYGHEELVGRTLEDLVHADDVEDTRAGLAETIATGRSPAGRARLRHRDGRWIDVEAKGTAVLDEHGAPKQVLVVVRELG
jgi:PAS domain S-box-containing protein